MAKALETLFTVLGFEYDKEGLEKYEQGLSNAVKKTKQAAMAAGAFAAANVGAAFGVLQLVNQEEQMAKQVGVSGNFLRKYGGIAQDAGLQIDNVADLIEEMNNKLGESAGMGKPIGPVADAFKMLELNFEKIILLKPEQQFEAISKAIIKAKNAGAADVLLGGEAQKYFRWVIESGKELDTLTKEQEEYTSVTSETAQVAVKWGKALNKIKQSLQVVGAELAARLLKVKDIEEIPKRFKRLLEENRGRLEAFVDGLRKFFNWIKETIKKIDKMAESFGGWKSVLKTVGAAVAGIMAFKIVGWIQTIIGLVTSLTAVITTAGVTFNIATAGIPLLIGLIVTGIALLILHWKKVSKFFLETWDKIKASVVGGLKSLKNDFMALFNFIFGGFIKAGKWIKKIPGISKFFGKKKPEDEEESQAGGMVKNAGRGVIATQPVMENISPATVPINALGGRQAGSTTTTSKTANVSQSINLNINGAGDPEAVAAAVQEQIKNLTGAAVENSMAGAF